MVHRILLNMQRRSLENPRTSLLKLPKKTLFTWLEVFNLDSLNFWGPLGWFHKGSKGEPVKSTGGITMFLTVRSLGNWSEVQSHMKLYTHIVHWWVSILCDTVLLFIHDVCLCSGSQLNGCTITTDLLLPLVSSSKVMWKHPIDPTHSHPTTI